MEQFNDTPIVNGTAYPTTTVEPKSYRFRILNAANDRFWNLQWYVADPTHRDDSEVALKPSEVAAAQTDPNVVPTPDTTISPAGPSWIQIGTEGGFLPAPAVVPTQPTTWITDPTRFDVGNVDKHSLLLAPAERADVVVDFSKFAGKTLILYNDAPAAFPARVAALRLLHRRPGPEPDGAPSVLPGYGPNTRTIMQVKVAATAPAPAFNLTALQTAFKHHADGSGVFESGQHPIIVGQAAYNSRLRHELRRQRQLQRDRTATNKCDGLRPHQRQGGRRSGFNTLQGPTPKLTIPIEPKAIHDEMNSATFDEFGRMTANLGVEARAADTGRAEHHCSTRTSNPPTELIDGTNLPMRRRQRSTPIADATDGTQIWKITHNGVDTHPIHFHLYDVQVLNRVTWDNIIIPPDAERARLEGHRADQPARGHDRRAAADHPDGAVRGPEQHPAAQPDDAARRRPSGFNNVDPQGQPDRPITNQLVNFGWEYVVPLPHPQPRGDGHDAAGAAGAAAAQAPEQSRRSTQPTEDADVERQLDHRDVVRRPEVPRRHDLDGRRGHRLAARPAEHPQARSAGRSGLRPELSRPTTESWPSTRSAQPTRPRPGIRARRSSRSRHRSSSAS